MNLGDAEESARWDRLFTCSVADIHLRRLGGLSVNRAAPDAVLIRLLRYSGRVLDFLWRTDLPPAVVQAALDDARWAVRAPIVEQFWHHAISREQWIRLLQAPVDEGRRPAVMCWCVDSGVVLPSEVIDRLVHDTHPSVRSIAAELAGVSAHQFATLVADPDPAVRKSAAPLAWATLDAAARQALLEDPEPQVRAAALVRMHQEPDRPMPVEVFEQLPDLAGLIAKTCALTPELFHCLVDSDRVDRRRDLASNPRLTAAQVGELGADPDPEVRLAVSVRPELTEQQRAAIPLEIDCATRSNTLPWVAAHHDDPETMRRLAGSAHPFVRRSVARAAHLPPDVVARLAKDPDRTVQLFLAESCHDATPELLLSVAARWSGSLSYMDRPRSHPNFPRTGLLHLAEDPNPLLRRLALDDQASDGALAERFADDPDLPVRERAAADPRLSPATLDRLLRDPELRWRAARNPGLPVARLVELLCSPDSARDAAANPRIPIAVMHRILDDADARERTAPP